MPTDGASAEEAVIGAGEQAMVSRALGELAPIYREVIVLREIEAMSYREISEARCSRAFGSCPVST